MIYGNHIFIFGLYYRILFVSVFFSDLKYYCFIFNISWQSQSQRMHNFDGMRLIKYTHKWIDWSDHRKFRSCHADISAPNPLKFVCPSRSRRYVIPSNIKREKFTKINKRQAKSNRYKKKKYIKNRKKWNRNRLELEKNFQIECKNCANSWITKCFVARTLADQTKATTKNFIIGRRLGGASVICRKSKWNHRHRDGMVPVGDWIG